MVSWKQALRAALLSGSIASVCSALALAVCGRIERGTAAGPNNGPSQWIWGEAAAYERRATVRHTLVGYAIHHLMSVGWALLHEKYLVRGIPPRSSTHGIALGAVTAATASFVDYRIARGRLQPGFDKQLSRKSLFMVYTAFALGLAAAGAITSRSRTAVQLSSDFHISRSRSAVQMRGSRMPPASSYARLTSNGMQWSKIANEPNRGRRRSQVSR
jgi:hypothetical protein